MSAAPMKLLIVDDEELARNRIKDLLDDCESQFPIDIVGEAENGVEAMKILEKNTADVVLLDIRMPEMDGMEFARHLLKMVNPPAVIFATAYDDYAVNAFEVHAIDYLMKPVRLGRLFNALSRARALKPQQEAVLKEISRTPRTHLSIQERGKVHLIPVADILYMKAELKYVSLRTKEREYLIEEALSALEEEFSQDFVRIHRSILAGKKHIVGFEKIQGEEGWQVVLAGIADRLPVSRRQQHLVKEFGG